MVNVLLRARHIVWLWATASAVTALVLLLVETSPEVEELVLLDTSPEVEELVLLDTSPDVDVVLD